VAKLQKTTQKATKLDILHPKLKNSGEGTTPHTPPLSAPQSRCLHTLHIFKPVLGLSLNKHANSHTSPEIFRSNFLAVCDELSDYHHIYTYGFKINSCVAAAAVSR